MGEGKEQLEGVGTGQVRNCYTGAFFVGRGILDGGGVWKKGEGFNLAQLPCFCSDCFLCPLCLSFIHCLDLCLRQAGDMQGCKDYQNPAHTQVLDKKCTQTQVKTKC